VWCYTFDKLIEHLAGNLLDKPKITKIQFNEYMHYMDRINYIFYIFKFI